MSRFPEPEHLLSQALAAHEWAGIAVVVLVNAAAVVTTSPARDTREPGRTATSEGMPASAGSPAKR